MRKVLATAFVAAVLVVLFASAQGTAALWRAEGTINAGVVTTGVWGLLASSGGDKPVPNFEFSSLDTSNMVPGQFVQAPLTLSNANAKSATYDLAGIGPASGAGQGPDSEFAHSITVRLTKIADSTACLAQKTIDGNLEYQGGIDSGARFINGPRTLSAAGTAGEAEMFCVRVMVNANMSVSASGGQIQLVLNFAGAEQ